MKIYKIYGVMLYDNQLNHDYLIFYNRRASLHGGMSNDLPYDFTGGSNYGAFNKIYQLDKDADNYVSKSISIMQNACDSSRLLMVKNEGFLRLVKTSVSHMPHYNGYDVYWNETASGINAFDYDLCAVWNVGSSSYSSYRVYEYKEI